MKILVGLSGGVDSACAASRLISMGHEVEGCVLVMHEHTDVMAAREVATSLCIPFHEVHCENSFNIIIKANFVDEYIAGRTPNPCIICNEKVKFAKLYEYAMERGFDAIATGHYAKVVKISGDDGLRYALASAEDTVKDQTYMLYRLPQHILSKLVLPLAEGKKDEVRQETREKGISASDRADSQEICFLPDGNHKGYIESVKGPSLPGDFVDEEGRVLGTHKGIINYTVGQRKGLGIALGERMFVTEISLEKNTVTLSPRMTGNSKVRISDMVFSGMAIPDEEVELELYVKIRYSAKLQKAIAKVKPDRTGLLCFDQPVKAAAPGQSAVLYLDGVVLAGGFISETFE